MNSQLNFNDQFSNKSYNNPPQLHDALPIMRARVIKTSDPKKIGRVQIRIPSFHGVIGLTERFVKDEDLPWAMPCFYGGSGQDLGSFMVPTPGTYVWVLFEDDDPNKPVYLGGVPGKGSMLSKKFNNVDDDDSPQQKWTTDPNIPDVPLDEYTGKSGNTPERPILYKSVKGHTIMCDDTDGEESMTFIDRVGQVIKFFSGVTQTGNKNKYRRVLRSAENNQQLGFELEGEPSIMIRSGELSFGEKQPKLHSMIQMFQTRMRGECIDSEKDKYTTTDYDPYEYKQRTQDSILDMTEDHIYISFPEILEYYCEEFYRLRAFEKCVLECTKDHVKLTYDGNGLFIDENGLKLMYKDTVLTEDKNSFNVKANDSFGMSAGGSSLGGDKNAISGSGKEVQFTGSGAIYTEGDKTYITGTEIHFVKK